VTQQPPSPDPQPDAWLNLEPGVDLVTDVQTGRTGTVIAVVVTYERHPLREGDPPDSVRFEASAGRVHVRFPSQLGDGKDIERRYDRRPDGSIPELVKVPM